MKLEDLKKSLTQMSDEECLEALQKARLERRVKTAERAETASKKKAAAATVKVVTTLTPEQRAELLAQLKG